MDSNSSPEDGCNHCDFSFAFNDSNFSDRVLRIYIFSEPIESPSVQVKTLHISSPILAARSPYFYKLFSNGMKESEQCHATLRINASEEAAVKELLKFMYSNNLRVTTAGAVLDVLVAADKFQVASCIKHCSRLLRNLPMTLESVLVYLGLSSTIIMSEAFRPVTVAAKQLYAVHYKDITTFQDEILSLPLADVEAIIASDDLRVESEDEVCRFVLKWAQAQYPNSMDRHKIIRTCLTKFIRYPYLTLGMLAYVITSTEFDLVFALDELAKALFFKNDVTYKQQQQQRRAKDSNLNHRFVKRGYNLRPLEMVEYKHPDPHPRVVVFMKLERDVCARLFPGGVFRSEAVDFRGHQLYFEAQRDMSPFHSFSLKLAIREMEAVDFAFDYAFVATLKPGEAEFANNLKGEYESCTSENKVGYRSLFEIQWDLFIKEDGVY